MKTPDWIFCSTPNCPHEAQLKDKCKWCYDVERWRKRKTTKSKISRTEEAAILDAVDTAAGKIQARTIKKLIKE